MKLLDGRDLSLFIKARHATMAAELRPRPKLAIIRSADNEAAERYLRAKSRYGADIGVDVITFAETPDTMLTRIAALNTDPSVTGIIIQLPVPGEDFTARALAAVDPAKDVDGLCPEPVFETATPKAVLWLLAAHDVSLAGRIVVVGQGRLVGKPLADRLEASGHQVVRCDEHTADLRTETLQADVLFSSTGVEHLIKSDMVKEGATVVDTGSPRPELDPELFNRPDLRLTPNPGGVGPMTVVSLFDNLLIAAENLTKKS